MGTISFLKFSLEDGTNKVQQAAADTQGLIFVWSIDDVDEIVQGLAGYKLGFSR